MDAKILSAKAQVAIGMLVAESKDLDALLVEDPDMEGFVLDDDVWDEIRAAFPIIPAAAKDLGDGLWTVASDDD